jgi:NADPH:quinone reductase
VNDQDRTPSAGVVNRAVVMRKTGPPEVLQVESLPVAALHPSEVWIRTLAAAVNHTDLEIRAGNWTIRREPALPYVPGVEVVGQIVDTGAAVEWPGVGDRVITMMQGLAGVRAVRPGGYQDFVTVDADAVAPVPDGADSLEAAALGLASVTARQGFETIGPLEGRRIAVTGAAGGVGSAAVALAAAKGAEVIAVVRDAARSAHLRKAGAAVVVDDVADIPSRSLDGVLDTVVGALFEPLLGALRDGGVLSVVGAVGGDFVTFSAWELIRPLTLTGYSSEDLDGASLRRATGEIFDLTQAGQLRPPSLQTVPLADAADAHRVLEQGGIQGRVLLVP